MNRFYGWFDRLQEPWRMLLFILIVPVLGLMPLSYGNDTVRGIAVVYLLILLFTRMAYRSSRNLAKAKVSREK